MLYKTKYSSIILYNSPDSYIDHQYAYQDYQDERKNFEKFYEIMNYISDNNIAIILDNIELNFFDGKKFHKDIKLKKILINNKTGWVSDWILESQLEKL